MDNPYQILGIPNKSDITIVKTAYRKLAIKYHPDKTGNDTHATKMFLKIQEAYENIVSGRVNIKTQTTYQKQQDAYAYHTRNAYKTIPTFIHVINIKSDNHGGVLIKVNLQNIVAVTTFSGSNIEWSINPRGVIGVLDFSRKQLEKCDYHVVLHFFDTHGMVYTKEYKFKDPRSWWTKFKKKYL
jgi:hypothetical protein